MIGDKNYPGTFKSADVYEMGNSEHNQTIEGLKKTLQFDDAINIQFTSVSFVNFPKHWFFGVFFPNVSQCQGVRNIWVQFPNTWKHALSSSKFLWLATYVSYNTVPLWLLQFRVGVRVCWGYAAAAALHSSVIMGVLDQIGRSIISWTSIASLAQGSGNNGSSDLIQNLHYYTTCTLASVGAGAECLQHEIIATPTGSSHNSTELYGTYLAE